MDRIIKSSRITVIFFILAVLLVVYASALYKLQIVDGEEYLEANSGSIATTSTVYAARGSILDRNGNLLASDRTVYNIKISRAKLLKQDDPNGIVLRLVKAAAQYGVSYSDTFPVTMSAPFSYSASASDTQMSHLESYLEYFSLDTDITAPDLITWLRNHYSIDYTTTAEDARLIIGVRYELELRAIVAMTDYTFAEDVSTDFITYINEQRLQCVSVESTSERQYYTKYAAHIIGSLGYITSTEYPTYKEQGYSLNSIVGKNGVEYAFESYLHGTDGSVTTYTDSSGAVTDVVVNSQAQAGDNIYLTIDIGLQAVAEDSLASTIAQMNAEREAANEALEEDEDPQELAEGGSVVVIDVTNGDVLVCASYPSFDLSTYTRDYSALLNDSLNPLWNRATQGTYNPGSTFKMVTALAGLNAGTITPYTTVVDEGKYTKYPSFQPTCWIYPYGTHGKLNVVGAIENSCNYFFYWLADQLGITPIAETAAEFGLGSKTGIEIGEKTGTVASREYKEEAINESWYTADTLMAAIGQSFNMFTPIQIANYIATIANGGTHYSTTILKYITSSDYSDILLKEEPEVLNTIDDSDGYISVLQRGMRAVATTGTAASIFANYDIPVAAKTGTTQSDTTSMNTGVFVCYAPADNPEIAVAIVVEKAGSGASLANIAKDILSAYFSTDELSDTIGVDNTLVK